MFNVLIFLNIFRSLLIFCNKISIIFNNDTFNFLYKLIDNYSFSATNYYFAKKTFFDNKSISIAGFNSFQLSITLCLLQKIIDKVTDIIDNYSFSANNYYFAKKTFFDNNSISIAGFNSFQLSISFYFIQ